MDIRKIKTLIEMLEESTLKEIEVISITNTSAPRKKRKCWLFSTPNTDETWKILFKIMDIFDMFTM